MKRFKETDAWINLSLIVVCTLITLVDWSVITLIKSYFVIGGWQLVSMLVHWHQHWFLRKGGARAWYHKITLGLLILAAIGSLLIGLLFLQLLFMLFMSPFLACWYTWICFEERRELKLAHSFNLK